MNHYFINVNYIFNKINSDPMFSFGVINDIKSPATIMIPIAFIYVTKYIRETGLVLQFRSCFKLYYVNGNG